MLNQHTPVNITTWQFCNNENNEITSGLITFNDSFVYMRLV
jgi:hypothetical protein